MSGAMPAPGNGMEMAGVLGGAPAAARAGRRKNEVHRAVQRFCVVVAASMMRTAIRITVIRSPRARTPARSTLLQCTVVALYAPASRVPTRAGRRRKASLCRKVMFCLDSGAAGEANMSDGVLKTVLSIRSACGRNVMKRRNRLVARARKVCMSENRFIETRQVDAENVACRRESRSVGATRRVFNHAILSMHCPCPGNARAWWRPVPGGSVIAETAAAARSAARIFLRHVCL